jgi:hypothetical protein
MYRSPVSVTRQHELNKAIDARFKENDIEIAFPQRDIHFDSGRWRYQLSIRLLCDTAVFKNHRTMLPSVKARNSSNARDISRCQTRNPISTVLAF